MCNGVVGLLQKRKRKRKDDRQMTKWTVHWDEEEDTSSQITVQNKTEKGDTTRNGRRKLAEDRGRENPPAVQPPKRRNVYRHYTRSSLNSIKANQFPKMSADIKRVQGEWERGRERANHIYHQCDLLITASKCSLKNQQHQHTRHKHNIFSPVGKTFRMLYKRLMIVFSFANRILAVDKLSLST